MKKKLKKFILNTGLLNVRKFFRPRTALILYYHSVADDPQEYGAYIAPAIVIETERFRRQMELLRKRYHPVTLEEIRRWLAGEINLPPRSVAVTFDDGFADNYAIAAPVMEQHDIRGTFYLTAHSVEHRSLPWFCKVHYLFDRWATVGKTFKDDASGHWFRVDTPAERRNAYQHFGYPCARAVAEEQEKWIAKVESLIGIAYNATDAPEMMTWNQADDLIRRGHIIGNHTFSHPNVAHLTPEDQRSEIERSDRLFRERLANPVEHFSYPHPCLNPQWDTASQEMITEAGYKTIVLTEPGGVTQQSSPLRLARVTIGDWTLDDFTWKIETAFAGINT